MKAIYTVHAKMTNYYNIKVVAESKEEALDHAKDEVERSGVYPAQEKYDAYIQDVMPWKA